MTGYAKRSCLLGDKKYTIEIKTLNSKQMDANVKVPAILRSKDLEIRSMLNQLERGKVDCILTEESGSDTASATLNADLLRERFTQAKQVAYSLHLDFEENDLFCTLLRQSELWESDTTTEMPDEQWEQLRKCIQEAIDEVGTFRLQEGEVLQKDFEKHVDAIEQFSHQVPSYEAERVEVAKERIRKYLADAEVKNVDENRFEQELIYYLEKLDITEEKVRLQKHIDYFRTTMRGSDCNGKKLGFIVQEMGREINTTGSKANHVEIQRLVVQMKDELEKIKEQLGNIL